MNTTPVQIRSDTSQENQDDRPPIESEFPSRREYLNALQAYSTRELEQFNLLEYSANFQEIFINIGAHFAIRL